MYHGIAAYPGCGAHYLIGPSAVPLGIASLEGYTQAA
jgi:hypothetical protein